LEASGAGRADEKRQSTATLISAPLVQPTSSLGKLAGELCTREQLAAQVAPTSSGSSSNSAGSGGAARRVEQERELRRIASQRHQLGGPASSSFISRPSAASASLAESQTKHESDMLSCAPPEVATRAAGEQARQVAGRPTNCAPSAGGSLASANSLAEGAHQAGGAQTRAPAASASRLEAPLQPKQRGGSSTTAQSQARREEKLIKSQFPPQQANQRAQLELGGEKAGEKLAQRQCAATCKQQFGAAQSGCQLGIYMDEKVRSNSIFCTRPTTSSPGPLRSILRSLAQSTADKKERQRVRAEKEIHGGGAACGPTTSSRVKPPARARGKRTSPPEATQVHGSPQAKGGPHLERRHRGGSSSQEKGSEQTGGLSINKWLSFRARSGKRAAAYQMEAAEVAQVAVGDQQQNKGQSVARQTDSSSASSSSSSSDSEADSDARLAAPLALTGQPETVPAGQSKSGITQRGAQSKLEAKESPPNSGEEPPSGSGGGREQMGGPLETSQSKGAPLVGAGELTSTYKLNPSSMFLLKAMRYYRLWIYSANLIIFLGALIFLLATMKVISDEKFQLLIARSSLSSSLGSSLPSSSTSDPSSSSSSSLGYNINGKQENRTLARRTLQDFRHFAKRLAALENRLDGVELWTTVGAGESELRVAEPKDGRGGELSESEEEAEETIVLGEEFGEKRGVKNIAISASEPALVFAYLLVSVQLGLLQAIGCFGAIQMKERWIQAYWYLILIMLILDICLLMYWLQRYDLMLQSLRLELSQRLSGSYGGLQEQVAPRGGHTFEGKSKQDDNQGNQQLEETRSGDKASWRQVQSSLGAHLPRSIVAHFDVTFTKIINQFQEQSQCCGVSNSLDYRQSYWRQVKLFQLSRSILAKLHSKKKKKSRKSTKAAVGNGKEQQMGVERGKNGPTAAESNISGKILVATKISGQSAVFVDNKDHQEGRNEEEEEEEEEEDEEEGAQKEEERKREFEQDKEQLMRLLERVPLVPATCCRAFSEPASEKSGGQGGGGSGQSGITGSGSVAPWPHSFGGAKGEMNGRKNNGRRDNERGEGEGEGGGSGSGSGGRPSRVVDILDDSQLESKVRVPAWSPSSSVGKVASHLRVGPAAGSGRGAEQSRRPPQSREAAEEALLWRRRAQKEAEELLFEGAFEEAKEWPVEQEVARKHDAQRGQSGAREESRAAEKGRTLAHVIDRRWASASLPLAGHKDDQEKGAHLRLGRNGVLKNGTGGAPVELEGAPLGKRKSRGHQKEAEKEKKQKLRAQLVIEKKEGGGRGTQHGRQSGGPSIWRRKRRRERPKHGDEGKQQQQQGKREGEGEQANQVGGRDAVQLAVRRAKLSYGVAGGALLSSGENVLIRLASSGLGGELTKEGDNKFSSLSNTNGPGGQIERPALEGNNNTWRQRQRPETEVEASREIRHSGLGGTSWAVASQVDGQGRVLARFIEFANRCDDWPRGEAQQTGINEGAAAAEVELAADKRAVAGEEAPDEDTEDEDEEERGQDYGAEGGEGYGWAEKVADLPAGGPQQEVGPAKGGDQLAVAERQIGSNFRLAKLRRAQLAEIRAALFERRPANGGANRSDSGSETSGDGGGQRLAAGLEGATAQFRWPNELQLSRQDYQIIEGFLLAELSSIGRQTARLDAAVRRAQELAPSRKDEGKTPPGGRPLARRSIASSARARRGPEMDSVGGPEVEAQGADRRRVLLAALVGEIRADPELGCLARSYYDRAQIHTQGCQPHIRHWLSGSANVLFVVGFCILTVLKFCCFVLLRLEIGEMIHKIKVLKGMATEYSALHDLDPYSLGPSLGGVQVAAAGELPACGALQTVGGAPLVASAASLGSGGTPVGAPGGEEQPQQQQQRKEATVQGPELGARKQQCGHTQSGGPAAKPLKRIGGSFSEAVVAATAAAQQQRRELELAASLANCARATSMKTMLMPLANESAGDALALSANSSSLSVVQCVHRHPSQQFASLLAGATGGASPAHPASGGPAGLFPGASMSRRHTAVCPAAAAAVAMAAPQLMSRRGTSALDTQLVFGPSNQGPSGRGGGGSPFALAAGGGPGSAAAAANLLLGDCSQRLLRLHQSTLGLDRQQVGPAAFQQHRHSAHTLQTPSSFLLAGGGANHARHRLSAFGSVGLFGGGSCAGASALLGASPAPLGALSSRRPSRQLQQQQSSASNSACTPDAQRQSPAKLGERAASNKSSTGQPGEVAGQRLEAPKRQSLGGAHSAATFSLDILPGQQLAESRRSIH